MKINFKHWIGILIIMLIPEGKLFSQQKQLDETIKKLHADFQRSLGTEVPSLSVYVISPKGTYFSSAKGKNGTDVNANTYFRFASNTKNFTATALLKMMQDGWIKLDDKITAFIPGTDVPYVPATATWDFPYKNQITIKKLLQHNAGVYDLTNDASQYNIDGEPFAEGLLKKDPNLQFDTELYAKALTEHKLTYGPPNTVYHYSNTGFSILGEIIARVYSVKTKSKKTYADYLYDNITGPNTKVPVKVKFVESALDQQLPSPYVKGLIHDDTTDEITDRKNASLHIAEGDGVGTMAELGKYIRTLMKGENVLLPATVELMKTSIGEANKVTDPKYGLGCDNFPKVGFGHNGATEGYLSLMVHHPENDITTIVLLPFWDVSHDMKNFKACLELLNTTSEEAQKVVEKNIY